MWIPQDPNTKTPVLNLGIIWNIMCKFEFYWWKLGGFTENKTGHILNLMDEISNLAFGKALLARLYLKVKVSITKLLSVYIIF